MTSDDRWARWLAEEEPQPESQPSISHASYDAYKLATPPEYEFLGDPPRTSKRVKLQPWMCGARMWPAFEWACTLPKGHDGRCNIWGEP